MEKRLSADASRSVPVDDVAGQAATRRDGGRLRWELLAFLELSALCGMAVAQPLLDVFGRSPDFLIFHRAGTADVLLLVAAITLIPALVLWGIGASIGLAGRRVRSASQAVLLGMVLALLAVQVGKSLTPLRGPALVAVAALLGVALAVVYPRFSAPRQVLRVAAVGPLVFVLLFVFGSAASPVLLNRGEGGSVAGTAVGPHPPVVMLIFDELPLLSLLDDQGRIDAQRYPNFSRLAGEATWYRNATAVAGSTTWAMPAMLTGRYPGRTPEAPHYSRYPDNLFTVLGDAYQIQAWESIAQLCPPEHCRGRSGQDRGGLPMMLREGADLFAQIVSPRESLANPTETLREPTLADETRARDRDPDVGPEFRFNRLGESQPARYTEFVDALRPTSEPTLRFLHLLMPHSPWTYLPSGTKYEGPGGLPLDGPWWARLAHQRHIAQVGYTDRLLGGILDTLEESGQYDDALIVVTSDHGNSFSEGISGRDLDEAQRAAAELAWVPLLIKEPGQRTGRVDDRNWEHVDLLPTLADHAGVRLPGPVDGISALGEERRTGDKRFSRSPGDTVVIDGPAHFAAIRQGSAARPALPAVPELALVGKAVADLPVTEGGPPVTVANLEAYADVRPDSGHLPALAHGYLPDGVAAGTPVAVALNGRIGTVALAAPDKEERLRFAGLITDESLFTAGPNSVEVYLVTGDGTGLRRLSPR
jgi:hypothetical protein